MKKIWEIVQEVTDVNLEMKKALAMYYLKMVKRNIAEREKFDPMTWEDRAYNRAMRFSSKLEEECSPQTNIDFSPILTRIHKIARQAGFAVNLDEETWTYIFQELVKDDQK